MVEGMGKNVWKRTCEILSGRQSIELTGILSSTVIQTAIQPRSGVLKQG